MTDTPKTALVTGAARRVGRAIADDLAAHGWAVAIHFDRSENEAAAAASAIRDAGGRATALQYDLADIDALGTMIDQTRTTLGPPTLLVNNASMFVSDRGGALESGAYRRQMAVNLDAPIFLSQAFAAALPKDVEGNVINLLDQSIWKPTPRHFSYQLSKVALWEATRMLAQSLAPRIRVNAIAPGPTLPHSAQSQQEFETRIATVLLKRGPTLAEFGQTIRYFVENRSVTGQVIALDGGQHLAWETPDVADIDT